MPYRQLILWLASSMLACNKNHYNVPLRSDGEVQQAIETGCAEAEVMKRPFLLEFSSPSNEASVALAKRKAEDVGLKAELEEWHVLLLNVGELDRHKDLLTAFEVKSLPTWAIVVPKYCTTPLYRWRRLGVVPAPATGPDATALLARMRQSPAFATENGSGTRSNVVPRANNSEFVYDDDMRKPTKYELEWNDPDRGPGPYEFKLTRLPNEGRATVDDLGWLTYSNQSFDKGTSEIHWKVFDGVDWSDEAVIQVRY